MNWILQLINDFIWLQPKIGHVILIPIVSTDYQVSQKIGPWSSHNVFFCVHTVLKVWQKMWRVHYLPYLHARMLFFQRFGCEVNRKIFPVCLWNQSWNNFVIHFATAETESQEISTLAFSYNSTWHRGGFIFFSALRRNRNKIFT